MNGIDFWVYDLFINKIKSIPQAEETLVDEGSGAVSYYVKNKEGKTVKLVVPMLGTENFRSGIEKLFQDILAGFGIVTLVDWVFGNECACRENKKLPIGLKAIMGKTVTFGFTIGDDYRIGELCDKLKETLISKHSNYGNSATTKPPFANCSVIDSLFVRYGDKFNRLKALRSGEQDKVGESVKDTILDIAGYSILILLAMEKEQE